MGQAASVKENGKTTFRVRTLLRHLRLNGILFLGTFKKYYLLCTAVK